MKIAIYQFNATIGALQSNTNKITEKIIEAKSQGCSLFLLPELALCGYPPEDLLLREDFHTQIRDNIDTFLNISGITIVLPTPYVIDGKCFNSALIIRDGVILSRYDKKLLPNESVFDDKRYFEPGASTCIVECNGVKIGIVICEDMWGSEPILETKKNGAQIICVLNASPFYDTKFEERVKVARRRVLDCNLPLIYVNAVGAQDEIVYDGASFILDTRGEICFQLKSFVEDVIYVEYDHNFVIKNNVVSNTYPNFEERIYSALVLGVRDYVHKNGFNGVVLGLSGGIDSALTLAIVVDAIGANNVTAVMMPSIYTAEISIADSRDMVKRLQIKDYHEIEINKIFAQFNQELAPIFNNMPIDATEENLQARIRGTLNMAISNKFGYLVLTTGNKSEMATGYATLYGDMAGGFAVLKDVLKTVVYRLSKWRNMDEEVIPSRIIKRPPSAELRDNQVDQDSLPDYEILDQIINHLVEDKLSVNDIINKGFSSVDVNKVAHLIKLNEYKRRQSAVGPKVTKTGFTKDWRYPITSHFKF